MNARELLRNMADKENFIIPERMFESLVNLLEQAYEEGYRDCNGGVEQ